MFLFLRTLEDGNSSKQQAPRGCDGNSQMNIDVEQSRRTTDWYHGADGTPVLKHQNSRALQSPPPCPANF